MRHGLMNVVVMKEEEAPWPCHCVVYGRTDEDATSESKRVNTKSFGAGTWIKLSSNGLDGDL